MNFGKVKKIINFNILPILVPCQGRMTLSYQHYKFNPSGLTIQHTAYWHKLECSMTLPMQWIDWNDNVLSITDVHGKQLSTMPNINHDYKTWMNQEPVNVSVLPGFGFHQKVLIDRNHSNQLSTTILFAMPNHGISDVFELQALNHDKQGVDVFGHSDLEAPAFSPLAQSHLIRIINAQDVLAIPFHLRYQSLSDTTSGLTRINLPCPWVRESF